MSALYTPEPWTVNLPVTGEDVTIVAYTKVHRNPVYVARVYGPGVLSRDTAERDANARLIVAAPEVLASLRELVDTLAFVSLEDGGETVSSAYADLFATARAAIAKTEGVA